jgi:hypothetical protein
MTKYIEEKNLLYQAFTMLKKTYGNFKLNVLKKPPSSCSDNGMDWLVGRKAYEYDYILCFFYKKS